MRTKSCGCDYGACFCGVPEKPKTDKEIIYDLEKSLNHFYTEFHKLTENMSKYKQQVRAEEQKKWKEIHNFTDLVKNIKKEVLQDSKDSAKIIQRLFHIYMEVDESEEVDVLAEALEELSENNSK